NMTPLEIMSKMIHRFQHVYAHEIQQINLAPGFSLLEIITLASIIEKEAANPDEKPIISSVFHNRLKRNMKLQSDPTAIYGIDNFNRDILHKDLERDTPYNTYRYKGLPPGPICNPGKDSIAAAIRPKQTSYLYFVSKGDGTHAFSKSLREHNRLVRIYRKKPKRR
ncbi:MAG: endolytic transglycosylase MltG, partial [Deltaproteobacteria bacterium]|nr:endolytic transglycosylase MltG [Deltaproteobacteria bacterium]